MASIEAGAVFFLPVIDTTHNQWSSAGSVPDTRRIQPGFVPALVTCRLLFTGMLASLRWRSIRAALLLCHRAFFRGLRGECRVVRRRFFTCEPKIAVSPLVFSKKQVVDQNRK